MTTDTTTTGARDDRPRVLALWFSAAALTVLILAQASGLLDAPARAEMVASTGGVTMMTTRSSNLEPLIVVDDRTETLFVYKTEQGVCELWARESLPKLFDNARARVMGRSQGRP